MSTLETWNETRDGYQVVVAATRGLKRSRMEDAWRVAWDLRHQGRRVHAVGVFDGLGGEPHGDRASRAAADGLREAVVGARSGLDVLQRLNPLVAQTRGASTAMVALLPGGGEGDVELVHVGDSGAFVADPDVRLVDVRDALGPSSLTDYLGNPALRGHALRFPFPANGLVLCTDGVDGVVGPASLAPLFLGAADDGLGRLRSLFAAVHAAGAPDNATLLWIRRA